LGNDLEEWRLTNVSLRVSEGDTGGGGGGDESMTELRIHPASPTPDALRPWGER